MPPSRMNLKGVSTLVVDGDRFTRGLVVQILRGFRMDSPLVCDSGEQAKEFIEKNPVDLCIVEAALPDMASPDLIGWLRRPEMSATRFVPVIVLSGYTQLRLVAAARDAGANTVLKKPVSPKSLFERILWAAKIPRPFIDAGNYVGPDRGFRSVEPPDKIYKRSNDLEAARNVPGSTTAQGTSR